MLKNLWSRLTEPSASIPDQEKRQVRLLSISLLTLVVLLLAAILINLFVPRFQTAARGYLFAGVFLIIGLAYALSRTRYYNVAGLLTVLITTAGVWVFAIKDQGNPDAVMQDLSFVAIALLLSSFFLSLRITLALSIAHFLAIVFLPVYIPGMRGTTEWETLLIFVAIMSALTLLVAGRHQEDLNEIQQRNHALAESEAQLQSILDNSTALISLKDTQGRYLLVNQQYLSSFKVDRAQIVGGTAAEIFPKEAADAYWANDQVVLHSGKSLEVKETASLPDGIHTYITIKFPLIGPDGNIFAVGNISTDITDRKLASEALLQSEERFRLVSYATSDAVWDWNFATDQIWWNQNIRRLFGYRTYDVRPDSGWWVEQIHPQDREKVISSLRAAIDGGQEFWSMEFRFRRSEGSYAHVFDRGYVIHDEQGKPVRVLGALMDITQWRQAEEEMEADRNLLHTMIDLLPDNIYIKDTEGHILVVNTSNARELGVGSPQEAIGKTIFDFFPPDLAAQYNVDDRAVVESGERIVNREEQRQDKDGNQKWFSTTKVPLRDNGGRIIGLVGIGHDITTRKQIEKALKEANESQTAWISELERRTKETGLLNEMSDLLQTCPNFEEAYRVIGELARQLFPKEAGGLYIINSSRDLADLVTSWGPPLEDPPGFQPNDCWGLRLGHLHIMERDAAGNNRSREAFAVRCNHIESSDVEAYACVPLFAQGDAIGLLHIRQSAESSGAIWFTEAKQQLARGMAYRVALALANLRLRETLRQQSIRDPLTGLFNRRYMEESLEREIQRAIRNQHPLGVIMMDIDRFKDFNDTFGHDAGDIVLREISALLRSKIRAEDIACRYGGEEFVLILPDASLEITGKRAERLREAVKHLDLKYKDQVLNSVSVSAGVAAFPDQGQNGGEILRAADVALYQAKHSGRDQVVLAASVSPESPLVFPAAKTTRLPAKPARKGKRE